MPVTLQAAVAHHQAGRFREAAAVYRAILDANPMDADALHLLGVVQLQTGDYENAADSIEQAVQLNPGNGEYVFNLGMAQAALKRFPDACQSFERVLEIDPNDAAAHANLGNVLLEQDKLDEAIANYRRALEIDPKSREAHNNLGNAWRRQGRLDDAVASYRNALAADPGFTEARENLDQALAAHGVIEQERDHYHRALGLAPSDEEGAEGDGVGGDTEITLPAGAETGLFLSVWDNLVLDVDLIRAIGEAHQAFRPIDPVTMFWYDCGGSQPRTPANPMERLAEIIIATVKPAKLAGVEYWTHTMEAGTGLAVHVDRDEKLFTVANRLAHPHIGTVYYPKPMSYTGGELVVNFDNVIKPRFNQLVAFNGSLPHMVRPVESGVRYSIALNLWGVTPSTYLE